MLISGVVSVHLKCCFVISNELTYKSRDIINAKFVLILRVPSLVSYESISVGRCFDL